MELEKETIERIRSGDNEALRDLYSKFRNTTISYLKRSGASQIEAEDIFQEAIITVYENIILGRFELTSSLQTYIVVVARNRLYRHLRSKKVKTQELIADSEELNQVNFEKEQERISKEDKQNHQMKLVQNALNQLGEPCRSILNLYYMKGLTTKEIAEEFGYTHASLKVKRFRCMQKLRELIKNFEDIEDLKF